MKKKFSITVLICYCGCVLSISWFLTSSSDCSGQLPDLELIDTPAETPSRNGTRSRCPSTMAGRGVPTFKTRDDLPAVLQREGLARGIELGVQNGNYAVKMLSTWVDCEEYHLVDLWGHQENYQDVANVDQHRQDERYAKAMENVRPWKDKVRVCRNYTSNCVRNYEDGYFDFIYVDARHDYKGVAEDIAAYWPKLREGGIMAGHDYVTNDDGPKGMGQDWTKNYDGTIDLTGTVVKGAVDSFAESVCRQVAVSYRESQWNTWAMRK